MSGNKQKLYNTQTDNLISNLRGEVGEILLTWSLYKKLRKNVGYLYTNDWQKNFENPDLILLEILIDKLENDIVANLSELAEIEIGKLTFYFALRKLNIEDELDPYFNEFRKNIKENKLTDKRNKFISHKQLPEKWTDHKEIYISMPVIGKCLSLAIRLMIKIDKIYLGPSAIYLWHECLKKKSKPIIPLNVNYMMLPHMHLSIEDRKAIIKKEMEIGYKIWEKVRTKVDGEERDVIICKKWGAFLLPSGQIMIIADYPLLEVKEISFSKFQE